jgi:hypothetical protein
MSGLLMLHRICHPVGGGKIHRILSEFPLRTISTDIIFLFLKMATDFWRLDQDIVALKFNIWKHRFLVVIRELLDSIFSIQMEPISPYRRSRWTHRDFCSVRLPTQVMTYPERSFGSAFFHTLRCETWNPGHLMVEWTLVQKWSQWWKFG